MILQYYCGSFFPVRFLPSMIFRLYFLVLFFLLALHNPLWAQVSVWESGKERIKSVKSNARKKQDKIKLWKDHIRDWGLDSNYNHALAAGARLNTNGWSGGIYFLQQKGAGRQAIWQFHFSEIKHEKETKQQNTGGVFAELGKGRPYIFGKVNNVYTLQLGYGQQQMLLPALLDGNLSLSVRYSAGPALALLKPYYLDLVYVVYTPEAVAHLQTEQLNKGNERRFLDPGSIWGAARWSKGLGETRFIPGLFTELAFVLEPDRPVAFVKTITIGGQAALYAKPLELMADRKAYPYQLSLFVGLALGKRWK